MAEALIFDCDGTLADTMPVHYEAWCQTLLPYGLRFEEARFYAWGGVPTREIIRRLSEEAGLELDLDVVTRERDAQFIRMAERIRPIEPVVQIARSNRGQRPMAVATGGTRAQVDVVLGALSLQDWFQTVVSADDVARGKPAPDVFLEAARRLGVEPAQCVVYEDAEAGLEAARAAGMRVIDVRGLG